MGVQHAGDSIEAETVKLVLVHPEAQVAQEKAEDLVTAVVEESAVPELVSALYALVKVLVIAAVELVQTVKHVLGRVTVDDIQQDGDSQAVGRVHQLFQIIGQAVATAGGKEAVDLVAETGVVGVLHDCHELNDVVAKVLYARQNVVSEFFVARDLWVGRRNADVGLVDAGAARLRRPLVLEDVAFLLGRVPEAGIVDRRDV